MGESWDISNTDPEPRESKWLAKGTHKKSHIQVIQTTTRVWLSLWVCPCVHTHIPFSNNQFTCFTTFCICGNVFLQSQRAKALSLNTGLMARIQHSHYHGPNLNLWPGTNTSLQAVLGWGHLRSILQFKIKGRIQICISYSFLFFL